MIYLLSDTVDRGGPMLPKDEQMLVLFSRHRKGVDIKGRTYDEFCDDPVMRRLLERVFALVGRSAE